MSVQDPTPGQLVTISAQSYSDDLNSSNITWTVNGKALSKGVGLTQVVVPAPALGKSSVVRMAVTTADGQNLSDSVTMTSASVDMVVETNGYTPPFFLGKVIPDYQNAVTIIAVPHLANSLGKEYDPKNLIYTWKQGSSVLQDQSGYGKQSVTITEGIIPRGYNISVQVSPRDNSSEGSGSVSVNPKAPSLSFYLNDPLYGTLFNTAIDSNVDMGANRESGVLAVPFGFNKPSNGIGDLSIDWNINNIDHPELAQSQSIILRAPNNTGGSANISLTIKNAKNILQEAQASFTADFTATSTVNNDVTF